MWDSRVWCDDKWLFGVAWINASTRWHWSPLPDLIMKLIGTNTPSVSPSRKQIHLESLFLLWLFSFIFLVDKVVIAKICCTKIFRNPLLELFVGADLLMLFIFDLNHICCQKQVNYTLLCFNTLIFLRIVWGAEGKVCMKWKTLKHKAEISEDAVSGSDLFGFDHFSVSSATILLGKPVF